MRIFNRIAIFITILISSAWPNDIPINTVQKRDVADWVFLGPIRKNSEAYKIVSKIEKDPIIYFTEINKENDLELKSIESQIPYGGQFYYQLYDRLDKGDIIFALSYIESKKDQKAIFVNNSFEGKFDIFLNGNFLINVNNQSERTEVDLKQGLNTVLLKIYPDNYNLELTNLYHRFFFYILPDTRFTMSGKILDENRQPIPFTTVTAFDNFVFHTTTTDENGSYKFDIYPVSKSYQITSEYNNRVSYTKNIDSKVGGEVNIDLVCNIQAEITGTVFTLDGETPNSGISVVLEAIGSKQNYDNWHGITDENGKFSIKPNTGSYNLSFFADGKKNYIYNKDGTKKIYKFSKKTKLKEEWAISNQVKGSWKSLNLFDGMLSNGVYDLLIGKDGLLYIATFNGFSIYDGQSILSYNFKNGLPNSQINELFEDSEGNIWLGYEYFGTIKWNNGIVEHLDYKMGLVGNSVRAIHQDIDGNMLFGTERGLSIYDGDNFKNLNYSDGLGNGGVNAIEVDGKNIWLGSPNPVGRLTLYNGKSLKNFDIPNSNLYGMNIGSIKRDQNGKIWFTDANNGLFSYDGQNFTNFTIMNGLPSNEAFDLFIDNNNEIWVTTNRGVAVFNGETFRTILDFNNDNALNLDNVNAVIKSRDGVFFFGQGNRGIIVYDPSSLRNITKSDGFLRSPVSDIQFDKNNKLWFSSWWGQGLHQIENEKIINSIKEENGLPSNFVNEFEFTSDGTMWIATRNGVATYKDQKVIKVLRKDDGLPTNNVISLAVDKNDNIWFYTIKGLTRYNGSSFTTYTEDDGLVLPRNNGDISIDKKGNIVFSTYGSGISIFDGKEFKNLSTKNGLVDDRIWDIGFDSGNNYWIATDGSGVQKYDGNSFTHYDEEDGVAAGETFSIYIDDFDMVWVGTFHGGACLFDGELWNCLDSRDGLIDNTISAIYGTNGNKVWFGSYKGITSYEPKRGASDIYLKEVITPQNVYNDKNLLLNDYSIVKGNRISFILNTSSFNTVQEKQKYKVKISHNGVEADSIIKTNEFNYTGNSSGDHTVTFQAIDRDLNMSKALIAQFTVLNPWYFNPSTAVPFWGIIALLLSFSGYTTNRYLKQRKLAISLRRESQKKDKEARKSLEEKNSELLESQKAAEAANEAKSTFLANMSHELRTPLNAIIGYSEMLIEDAEDEKEDFIPDLDKINSSGKHLLGLINDILDLSKVESGKMELFIEDFNLEKILNEVVDTITPLVEKNNNTIKLSIKTKTQSVLADVTKIRQILLNLLSNATKFTKDGDINILVGDNPENDLVLDFKVSDSGIGMTPDQVAKVFKPFTQADEKTTRKFGGTGLGLTITKMFAEMMGGKIELSSVINEGTTFTVSIPKKVIDSKKVKGQIKEVLPLGDSSNFSVLVIDDDPNAQNLMEKFLKKENYNVLQATSGTIGLDLAAKHLPDLITLDVMMPEMDGWEVLTALQNNETTKNIPVIMLTMTNERDIGYSLGATDYLTKPVDWNKLSKILKKHEIETESESILIVEDDQITRDMLTKSLETNDFKVILAKNGKEALDRVNKVKPALILLDLMMPEMDGFEFAERLREKKEWLDIPVVVITAKDLTKEDHSRLRGNVEAIMQKGSYNKDKLLDEVGNRIKKIKDKG